MVDNNKGNTLVVGPSWVGDMVMAQTLFITLKSLYPDTAIDVLAPAWSEPLLNRMPEVRQALTLPFGHGELKLRARMAFGQSLKSRRYSQAFVLPNSFKSALIPLFAGIPQRIGWRGEMRYGLLTDIRLLDKKRYPLMIERFAALAYPAGAALPESLPHPALQVDPQAVAALPGRYDLSLERPILALCPGAEFGPSKRWPARSYAAVAGELIGRGWQVWIFGSANDAAVAEQIVSGLPGEARPWCQVLAGRTSLADAIDLLASAAVVVSNDSGLMHIAAALNRPLVVVYGSTSPGFTPPLTDNVSVLQPSIDCSPCFERECPLNKAREKMQCMEQTTPEQVIAAIEGLKLPVGVDV